MNAKSTIVKQTKTQVLAEIKKHGQWTGYLAGNKVHPAHVTGGWHLGYYVTVKSKEELEDRITSMLAYLERELGNGIAFWKEVKLKEE